MKGAVCMGCGNRSSAKNVYPSLQLCKRVCRKCRRWTTKGADWAWQDNKLLVRWMNVYLDVYGDPRSLKGPQRDLNATYQHFLKMVKP